MSDLYIKMDTSTWPHTFIDQYISPFWQIVACWTLMLLMLRIRTLGIAFRVYNTLFHELGHAIFSLVSSGSVKKIELFSDAGGAAYISNKGWLANFMVTIIAYPFAAAAGWFMLTQTQRFSTHYLAYTIAAIYLLSLLLYVRNKYGVIWLLINLAITCAAIYFQQHTWAHLYFFVVGSFILMESVWTALVLLYISAEDPGNAGDAKDLRDLTKIPAVVWALLFAAVTLYFVNLTLSGVIGWTLWT